MRKIAVYTNFMNEERRKRIELTAERLGFQTDFFDTDDKTLWESIDSYEVIFGYPSPELIQRAKNLHWFCSAAAGIEKYLKVLPSPNCLLTTGSGAYGTTISEHILMVLLMLLRRMPEYRPILEKRQWICLDPIRSITGSRIIMLGTGDIGSNTARRLHALGANVTGVCRSGKASEPAFERVLPLTELDTVLPDADALILALPATPETEGILSRERLALLPPSAYVINVGRGSCIDQEALMEALKANHLAGAALDVMTPEPLPKDHPLWDCPNLILTPHISGNMSLALTCEWAVDLFCRNLQHYAAGEPLENQVDPSRGY